MKKVKEMPTSGQFVAVWEYDGNLWSNTMEWKEDGCLYHYEETGDKWIYNAPDCFPSYLNVTFFIL